MIKSMTGYGKGRFSNRLGIVSAEIRSVNHKYFDLVSHLPNHLSILEDKVREYVKKRVSRGRITITVFWESKNKTQTPFFLNVKLAKKYYVELTKLRKELGIKEDLGIAQIVSLPEVISFEQTTEDIQHIWPCLEKALSDGLNKLNRMREAEGKRLYADLHRRAQAINSDLQRIEAQSPRVIEQYRQNLFKKTAALSEAVKISEDKIAEEVALYARNCDITEEIIRIKSHLQGLQLSLHNRREAGKELDFIAQEMFREANTIGAKSSDCQIARCVIKIKSQIEKMREQLQNVE